MSRVPLASIVVLLGSGVAVAIGLAGMHPSSLEVWAGVVLLATWGVLLLAMIGVIDRGRGDRPRRVGFAAFGWGYWALARWYAYHQGPLPTAGWVPGSSPLHGDLRSAAPLVRIAHDAGALAFAALGGAVAASFFSRHSPADRPRLVEEPRGWWRCPTVLGMLASAWIIAATLAGWLWDPDLGAGVAFLSAWALAGLAIVGAACARGKTRAAWIGAAAFGVGYLILAFGPICPAALPTNHLLNAIVRPGGPTTANDLPNDDPRTEEASRRLRQALDEPVSLHFPEGTHLRAVLDRIGAAVRGRLGQDFILLAPWYEFRLSPAGFDALVVAVDCERTPVRDALRLCLKPLGMTYHVRSGYVRIGPDAARAIPFEEAPVMIAGHSVLAFLAAAIGGAAASVFAGSAFAGMRGEGPARPIRSPTSPITPAPEASP